MSIVGAGILGAYVILTAAGLVKTRLLRPIVIQPFRETLPMMIEGFWKTRPDLTWPGSLKALCYPFTLAFLVFLVTFFTLFHLLILVVASPKIIWWLFSWHPGVGGAPA